MCQTFRATKHQSPLPLMSQVGPWVVQSFLLPRIFVGRLKRYFKEEFIYLFIIEHLNFFFDSLEFFLNNSFTIGCVLIQYWRAIFS